MTDSDRSAVFPQDEDRLAETLSGAPEAGQGQGARKPRRNGDGRGPRWTSTPRPEARKRRSPVYAALDLGTNNCRLLIARPTDSGFRVLDGFSRIVRLGEGLSQTARLSEAAMDRTVEALKLCKAKLAQHEGIRARIIATEA